VRILTYAVRQYIRTILVVCDATSSTLVYRDEISRVVLSLAGVAFVTTLAGSAEPLLTNLVIEWLGLGLGWLNLLG
jgi:hypothetical protein